MKNKTSILRNKIERRAQSLLLLFDVCTHIPITLPVNVICRVAKQKRFDRPIWAIDEYESIRQFSDSFNRTLFASPPCVIFQLSPL